MGAVATAAAGRRHVALWVPETVRSGTHFNGTEEEGGERRRGVILVSWITNITVWELVVGIWPRLNLGEYNGGINGESTTQNSMTVKLQIKICLYL